MALTGPQPDDGSLLSWDEVPWEEAAAGYDGWPGLLLGNGLSRGVSEEFAYDSLFEKAPRKGKWALTDEDCGLFEVLETRNFERVLADLAAAIRMAEALGENTAPYLERYKSVQEALGGAVRAVHPEHREVPAHVLEEIGRLLQRHECVFTTSYDLIVYWAMAAVGFGGLCDCFWDGVSFDSNESGPRGDLTPLYFLHGALHLVAMGSGRTRKRRNTMLNLLDQYGRPLDGDDQARPLFVTEGSARHKLAAIEENAYLSAALRRLRGFQGPLVVFGSRLSEEDRHLVDAINHHPDRPVAVSIHPEGKSRTEIRSTKRLLGSRLHTERLYCFDATTHPLGVATRSRR